eukprot:gene6277-8644_t
MSVISSTNSLSTTNNQRKILGSIGNHIKIGIIGTTNVGKSGLFNMFVRSHDQSFAVCDDFLFSTIDPNVATFDGYDTKISYLMQMHSHCNSYNNSKLTIIDTAGIVTGSFLQSKGVGVSSIQILTKADVLLHIVRAYDNQDVVHYEGSIDPVRDINIVNQEILLMDLFKVEQSIMEIEEILFSSEGGEFIQFQHMTLVKAWSVLAGDNRPTPDRTFSKKSAAKNRSKKPKIPAKCYGIALRFAKWDHQEALILNSYDFISAKEVVYCANITSREYLMGMNSSNHQYLASIKDAIDMQGGGELIPISIEFEQSLLDIERENGLDEYFQANPTHRSCIPIITQELYRSLEIIHFYICNETEVKCYCLKQGSTLSEAASKVDENIARSLLRGDVISYDDFFAYKGDREVLHRESKIKSETKKYFVNDGDILEFICK